MSISFLNPLPLIKQVKHFDSKYEYKRYQNKINDGYEPIGEKKS